MAIDPGHKSRPLREEPDRAVERSMMKAIGFTDEDLARRGDASCRVLTSHFPNTV